jgi:septal ring factor EnvC (AmiA/AmiB activator)
MKVPNTSEEKVQADATDKQVEAAIPSKKPSRKSILALSVFALGLNATAAVYTQSPSDFALPDVSRLAELLPHERAPVPDVVVAALKDIQSVQQQQAATLQEHTALLQQNVALLQQDSATFDALRHSLSDEKSDVKKVSSQLSTLMTKVDTLQNAISTEITSSIPKGRARARLSAAARKRMARQAKPLGPVSVGGAPLTTTPALSGSIQSPEG